MVVAAVPADKADLGREVRRDACGGGEWRKRRTHEDEGTRGRLRARGARYPLSRRSFSLR